MKLVGTFHLDAVDTEALEMEYDGLPWKLVHVGYYCEFSPDGTRKAGSTYEFQCAEDPQRYIRLCIDGAKVGDGEEYLDDVPAPPPQAPSPELELEDIEAATKVARILRKQMSSFHGFCECVADGDLEGAYGFAGDFYDASRLEADEFLPDWMGEDLEPPPAGWSIEALGFMLSELGEFMGELERCDAYDVACERRK